MSSGDWLTLDVGGTIFKTHRSTLVSVPDSVLYDMFHQDNGTVRKNQEGVYQLDMCTRNEEGVYQLDVSPALFTILLDYLRHRVLMVPATVDPQHVRILAGQMKLKEVVAIIDGDQGSDSGLSSVSTPTKVVSVL